MTKKEKRKRGERRRVSNQLEGSELLDRNSQDASSFLQVTCVTAKNKEEVVGGKTEIELSPCEQIN